MRATASGSRWPCRRSKASGECGILYTTWSLQDILGTSTTISVRIDSDMKDRLERLANATQRSKSFLAAEAIRHFVDINEWQISEVYAALTEANADDFATDKDVAALTRKWRRK